MRRLFLFVLSLALLGAGCAVPVQQPRRPVMFAAQRGIGYIPSVGSPSGIQFELQADPLAGVKDGTVDVALVIGQVPEGLEGFGFSPNETVLMQGWMDPPRALSKAEALALAEGLKAPREPGPGALAKGQLKDMRPGWRAIPVDGVLPTMETVWNGSYPLAGMTSVIFRPGADSRVRGVIEGLQQQAGKPPDEPRARLSFTGDMMLARGVARAMREKGTLYPVAKVAEHLAAADLTFVNLESPIGVKGKPLPGKQIWFRAAPEAVDLLKAAGVDGLTLANNHIIDYDTENFLETLERLDEAGIRYTGGGRNIVEARRPLVMKAKGIPVAFLGYSQFADLFFDWNYPRSFAATESVPGVAGINEEWLAADIAAARATPAMVVVVSFHWGEEFQNYPTEEQKRLARKAIDLGADLVIGHHPHAIQGLEIYKGKLIAYSLGNFIMDRQETDLARESMILDVEITSGGVRSATVQPVWIKDEQPYMMTGPDAESLRTKIRTISGWK